MHVLLLALVVLLGLAACGGGDDEAGDDSPPPAATGEETTTGEVTTEETPEEEGEGDAEAGADVFAEAGCGSCHTLDAAGSSGSVGPNLDESKPDFELVVDRVTNGKGNMPSFSGQLSEQEIADVAAYVSESASG